MANCFTPRFEPMQYLVVRRSWRIEEIDYENVSLSECRADRHRCSAYA